MAWAKFSSDYKTQSFGEIRFQRYLRWEIGTLQHLFDLGSHGGLLEATLLLGFGGLKEIQVEIEDFEEIQPHFPWFFFSPFLPS